MLERTSLAWLLVAALPCSCRPPQASAIRAPRIHASTYVIVVKDRRHGTYSAGRCSSSSYEDESRGRIGSEEDKVACKEQRVRTGSLSEHAIRRARNPTRTVKFEGGLGP